MQGHNDVRDLSVLGGPDAELSTGLVLAWQDRLIFGLDLNAVPLGARGTAGVLAFVGIGGHLDPGEGWGQAVMREALEEACCQIELTDSPLTYWCSQNAEPRRVVYRWTEPYRPLLVWTATFHLRRGPLRQRRPVNMVTAVFRADAQCQPQPSAEISALLVMDEATLLHAFATPRPLGELLDCGAQLIGESPGCDTLLAPGGTAYFHAQWLAWQNHSLK
jgi:hypothetical protein